MPVGRVCVVRFPAGHVVRHLLIVGLQHGVVRAIIHLLLQMGGRARCWHQLVQPILGLWRRLAAQHLLERGRLTLFHVWNGWLVHHDHHLSSVHLLVARLGASRADPVKRRLVRADFLCFGYTYDIIVATFCYSIACLFDAKLLRQRHLAALVFWTHELQQSLGRPGAFLFCYHFARCIILDASIALRRRCLLSWALLLLVEGAASVFLLHDLRLTIESCSPPATR